MITVFALAFIAAIWVASTIYRLIPVPHSVDQAALARVMASEQSESLPFWRALLLPFNQLAQHLPPTLVGNTIKQLYWAQFQGEWLGWTPIEFWGLRLAAVIVGTVVGMFLGNGDMLIAAIVPALLYIYLGNKLDKPAKQGMRQIQRELPEVAQTLALLVSTGKSESEALQEIASGAGMLHTWIRRVLASRPPDVPLFSDVRGGSSSRNSLGFLRREAERSGSANLISFATQLDFLKVSGVGANILLGNLADTVAADYEAEVNARAEALGDTLMLPVMIFYFVPYLIGLMAPMFASSMAGIMH